MGHSRSCRCDRCRYRYQRRDCCEHREEHCGEHRSRHCKYCGPKNVVINNCCSRVPIYNSYSYLPAPAISYGYRPYYGYQNVWW